MKKAERFTNLTTGGPVFVDVEDGKIVRITPLKLDENDAESWKIEARGRVFSPPRRTTLAPWAVAHRSSIYSPKRILTPLKRRDFDVNGKRNCHSRGVSDYVPISWDEALDIVAAEMIRIKRELGPAGILTSTGSHHLWGNIGYRHSTYQRFMNLVGMTHAEHNPDSWEGWHWGAMHMFGFSHKLGIPEQCDLLEDALKNTEMIVFWSADPEANMGGYGAFESTPRRRWLRELGVKMVFIDPYFNQTAILHCDKWFAPRPGTDVALGLAIAYVWLTEGTYDKDYVAHRTTGFDEWKAYVLGESDGTPKTPAWAERECTVPAREIYALAREWGSKRTMLASGGLGGWGGACRAATGNEWARMMVALAAMQGMGKPGSNIWGTTLGAPANPTFVFPGYSEGGISGDLSNSSAGLRWVYRMFPRGGVTVNPHRASDGQTVPRLRIPEAMLHERLEWRGKGFCTSAIESQFHKNEYPAPGYPMVGMYYRYGGSFIGTMTETNRYVSSYQTDRISFVVNQSIWMEGEAKFADIILPACTNFERWDIGEWAGMAGRGDNTNHRVIVLQKKCIEPLGESKSDYAIFAELSKRLGVWDLFTDGGKTELDWVKQMFHASDLPTAISWEDFEKKGYYVVPPPKGRKPTPALRWFAEDRRRDTPEAGPHPADTVGLKGLQTTSGKIEFVASSLKRFEETGTVDPERPAMGPQYIESWEGHHSELYRSYPLQLISPHPRFSFHTHGDAKDSWTNEINDHRLLKEDGRYYWILRINPADAKPRGIADGDLIRVFNDRGSVILAARVTERVRQGTVHSYESCADYEPLGEPGRSPDTAGCVNILTPSRYITPTSPGTACNSCLVEVESWRG